MVELSRYKKKSPFSVLPTFLGVSLVIISIGLSIAIAKSENLSFSNNNQGLSLNREAVKLESEALKIRQLAGEIKDKNSSKKIKVEAESIIKEVEVTGDSIQKILEK